MTEVYMERKHSLYEEKNQEDVKQLLLEDGDPDPICRNEAARGQRERSQDGKEKPKLKEREREKDTHTAVLMGHNRVD